MDAEPIRGGFGKQFSRMEVDAGSEAHNRANRIEIALRTSPSAVSMRFFYFSLDSQMNVTGPSLVRCTCMEA